MTDREKVVRALDCLSRNAQDVPCNGCAYFRPFTDDPDTGWCDRTAVMTDALELLKEPTVGGWVSVKDRMPEEKENPLTHDFTEVICFCDFGGRPKRTDIWIYEFGKRCYENEPHFWHGPQIMDGVVTHWMPLPEPPEEVQNGDEH